MKKLLCIAVCYLLYLNVHGQHPDFAKVDFRRADSIADFHHGRELQQLRVLALDLTASLPTEVEKFRAIYTWVCKNVENDFRNSLHVEKKINRLYHHKKKWSEWNQSFSREVFQKLLLEKKTICTGYAYLVKTLTNLIGIPCEIVDGYGRTSQSNVEEMGLPNHSWNAVKLNGRWYLCDPTWSSGNSYAYGGIALFKFQYNPGYFLTEPEFFMMNHYPLDTQWLLTDSTYSKHDFVQAPLVYSAAFNYGITPVAPNNMHLNYAKNQAIHFTFEATEDFDINRVYLNIRSGSYTATADPTFIKRQGNLVTFSHRFERRGSFDLHFKVGEDFLVTYVVEVER
jgi:hypothetical protein